MSAAPAPILTALALGDTAGLERAVDACAGAEVLPITTCQRHELLVLGPPVTPLPEGAAHIAEQADAATRLFMLASGALSDVPGERFVADQLRAALQTARRAGLCGRRLGRLARLALESGDAVRQRVEGTAEILELPDLVADLVRDHLAKVIRAQGMTNRTANAAIALLGAGPLARATRRALARRGMEVACWATRRPSAHRGPRLTLEEARGALSGCAVVIAALAEGPGAPLQVAAGGLAIDLGNRAGLDRADWTASSIVEHARPRLLPQQEALRRATHRLSSVAASALAQVISPSIATAAAAIGRFRDDVIEAELCRLKPLLDRLDEGDADRVRRSLRHAAARCLHPLHDYVNQLGRQMRPDEAGLLVDHLLGTRVGLSDVRASDVRASDVRASDVRASTTNEDERGSTPGA